MLIVKSQGNHLPLVTAGNYDMVIIAKWLYHHYRVAKTEEDNFLVDIFSTS